MKKFIIFAFLMFAMACACSPGSMSIKRDGVGLGAFDAALHTVRIIKQDKGISRVVIDGGLVEEEWEDGASGTGVVISVKDGHSLVATARHVSHTDSVTVAQVSESEEGPPLEGVYAVIEVKSQTFEVSRYEGEECSAREVYHDPVNDFALIDVNCELGSPAELSRSTPNYGSSIVVVGNPLNLYDNVFVPMEGLYVGKVSARRVMNTHLITAPIVEGYSGAGVWQEGKLVGIANMVNTIKGYRNLSYMIPIDVIRADLRMYELSLGKIDGG